MQENTAAAPGTLPEDPIRQFVATVVHQLLGADILLRQLPAELQPLANESLAFSQAFASITTAMACITYAGAEMTAFRLQQSKEQQPK